MTSTAYRPRPDTVPDRVLQYMAKHPAGTRLPPEDIAAALAVPRKNFLAQCEAAVNHGLIVATGELHRRRWALASAPPPAAQGDEENDSDPIVRRTVSAAGARPALTSAPNSVFDVGRRLGTTEPAPPAPAPRRSPTPPLAALRIEIRHGVPKPPARAGVTSVYLDVLQRMQPGDSVELPLVQARSFYARAKEAAKAHAPPQQYSFRKLNEQTGGVWRDA